MHQNNKLCNKMIIIKNIQDGNTPLFLACMPSQNNSNKSSEIVKLLLGANADVRITNRVSFYFCLFDLFNC